MSEQAEVLPLPVAHEGYKPSLALTPAEAGKLVRDTHEICKAILVEGGDFGTISGTDKPSMWKAGAEKLLAFFGFCHRMELVEVERDANGKKVGVTYRCVVTKATATGEMTVASCDGYCGYDEPGRPKNSPWNTVIKMAQKRALVGAALQATGTSALFTQDIEDMGAGGPSPYVEHAVRVVKGLSERVRSELKTWMQSRGIAPLGWKDWTPEQVAELLLKAGALSALEVMGEPDDEVVDGEVMEESA